ncbi:unnamed protein product [Enterobius vermicularis]|uniref:Secreted protein n=1 Tax=Enterobius vermicularis TaxID=51028 RepID=A0A0N4UVI4_ENTVE|nr:unnamed protein product [Enterobius vermicularis]
MSVELDFKQENEMPVIFLSVLLVLLVLLAAAIWVAFFSALRKALSRFAELKRHRRRQNILATIGERSMNGHRIASNVFAAFPFGYDQNTYISNVPIAALTVPPSYEEAMTQSPSAVSAVQIPAINRRPSSDTTVASISTAAESDKTDNNSTRQQQSQQLSHLV